MLQNHQSEPRGKWLSLSVPEIQGFLPFWDGLWVWEVTATSVIIMITMSLSIHRLSIIITLHHLITIIIIIIIITREKQSQVSGDTEDMEEDITDIMVIDPIMNMVTNITDIVTTTGMDMSTAMKRDITINSPYVCVLYNYIIYYNHKLDQA